MATIGLALLSKELYLCSLNMKAIIAMRLAPAELLDLDVSVVVVVSGIFVPLIQTVLSEFSVILASSITHA